MAFSGQAVLKDKTAGPLTYLWDFGGGVFENSHPQSLSGQVSFVRDNSTYRVRFSATDRHQRRCEAAVEVQVGTPPDTGLAKVPERDAPLRGSGVKPESAYVVLPFQDLSMQETNDTKTTPALFLPSNRVRANIQAYLIKKGGVGANKPQILFDQDRYQLQYSAASNPLDPVGAESINSTSQNWPVSADPAQPIPFASTQVQKTDMWELASRPATDPRAANYEYGRNSWLDWFSRDKTLNPILPFDVGYFPALLPNPISWDAYLALNLDVWKSWFPNSTEAEIIGMLRNWNYDDTINNFTKTIPAFYGAVNSDRGRSMPGKDGPYSVNQPQDFSRLISDPTSPRTTYAANRIPVTDIDDKGRVNPYPVFRVEVKDLAAGNPAVLAAADTVVSNSRDMHCRECHLKGEGNEHLGANTSVKFNRAMNWYKQNHNSPDIPYGPPGATQKFYDKPDFYDVSAAGGNPASIYDQEWTAAININSLHQFYALGFYGWSSWLHEGGTLDYILKGQPTRDGKATMDVSLGCTSDCHHDAPSVLEKQAYNARHSKLVASNADYREPSNYYPIWSMAIHKYHGELQYNSDRSDIIRWDNPDDTDVAHAVGLFKRWDWVDASKNSTPNNPNSLFPVTDANGNSLPMEGNCLRCHAGKREELYRDVHKTAGTTCYDCHGDMASVGLAYPQNASHKTDAGRDYREPWYDEPDCGSCHTGDGNQGADGSAAYFSAGVLKRAFDADDPSATPRKPDLSDTNASRFAVPVSKLDPTEDIMEAPTTTTLEVRLYRMGHDKHANLSCGACHGGSHGLWPNKDSKANDNLTALQLQGYEGPIRECSVCHTEGAFDKGELDKSTLKDGVLAGPHGMHPLHDPSWYGTATDTAGHTVRGGWHARYLTLPGAEGEDQCAACHGKDHKGTRLSKAAVDREYKSPDGRAIKFAKGEAVGCDGCHSLETSFNGAPDGTGGGNGNRGNHSPQITSFPPGGVDSGADFSYQVTATDADADALSFSLTKSPEGMAIDPVTGLITWKVPEFAGNTPFQVQVSDGKGGSATQGAILTFCWPGTKWHAEMSHCM
ncbi:MAG: Ig domain-containing protein [Methylococcus sp.]|nr:Ig domain-containing protein [Methylococcus sp.]